jgi:hypothetical protein
LKGLGEEEEEKKKEDGVNCSACWGPAEGRGAGSIIIAAFGPGLERVTFLIIPFSIKAVIMII